MTYYNLVCLFNVFYVQQANQLLSAKTHDPKDQTLCTTQDPRITAKLGWQCSSYHWLLLTIRISLYDY